MGKQYFLYFCSEEAPKDLVRENSCTNELSFSFLDENSEWDTSITLSTQPVSCYWFSFYTPWKYKKTSGFLCFLQVKKEISGMKRVSKISLLKVICAINQSILTDVVPQAGYQWHLHLPQRLGKKAQRK